MIIVDVSQIFYANLMVNFKKTKGMDIDILRGMFFKSLQTLRKHFRDHNRIVLAFDHPESWRKEIFPPYKGNRKKSNVIDWDRAHQILDQIREEVHAVFPYKVLYIPKCEADDIIAALVMQYHLDAPIVIVSGDQDFLQLQSYPVTQFNPIRKEIVKIEDPIEFLLEHILKGDDGDGVPNVFSDDDTLINPAKRSARMTPKRMEELKEMVRKPRHEWDPKLIRNFDRNQTLIDLSNVPAVYQNVIWKQFESQPVADGSKIFTYFMNNGLSKLSLEVSNFV